MDEISLNGAASGETYCPYGEPRAGPRETKDRHFLEIRWGRLSRDEISLNGVAMSEAYCLYVEEMAGPP